MTFASLSSLVFLRFPRRPTKAGVRYQPRFAVASPKTTFVSTMAAQMIAEFVQVFCMEKQSEWFSQA
jgi:hypothetical protein